MDEAAQRESREEANANLTLEGLYTVISLPTINQVYVMYRARLQDLDFHPGEESLHYTLERYFEDRRQNRFPVHVHAIHANNRQPDE